MEDPLDVSTVDETFFEEEGQDAFGSLRIEAAVRERHAVVMPVDESGRGAQRAMQDPAPTSTERVEKHTERTPTLDRGRTRESIATLIAEGGQDLLASRELDARPACRLAPSDLEGVQLLPFRIGHESNATLAQGLLERRSGGGARRGEPPGLRVLEHRADRLDGIGLVRADDPTGATLDPSRGVETGNGSRGYRVDQAALVVGQDPASFVKRQVGQGQAPVADRPEDDSAVEQFGLVGRRGLQVARGITRQHVSHDAHPGDPALGVRQNLGGGDEEAQL